MITLHLNATTEKNPRAIVPDCNERNGDLRFEEDNLSGKWFRVFPSTGDDVRFLQSIELHLDKFAPAVGGGVLLHPRAMPFQVLTGNRN